MTSAPTRQPLPLLVKQAHDRGKAMLIALSSFNSAYLAIKRSTPPCDDETGFRILELFRKHIQTFVFDYKRGSEVGLKQAANELYRLLVVRNASYTREELDGFVDWYGRLKNRISKKIGDLFDYHGDGYSDLCESLPLAGTDIVKRCLATNGKSRDGFLTEEEISVYVRSAVDPHWAKLVLSGEHYVESVLERQAYYWFVYDIQRNEELFPEPADGSDPHAAIALWDQFWHD